VAVGSPASVDLDRLEAEILEVGRAIAARMESARRSPGRAIDDRAMALASRDRELRAAMFRLVDVTPACRSLDDLGRHLVGLVEQVPDRPPSIEAAMRAAHTKAGRVTLGAAVAAGVRHMAHRFIAGEDADDAMGELERLWRRGIGFSADLLGEATVTATEADRYAARCTETLERLAAGTGDWPPREVLERDSVGPLPRVNLSVKVSALTPVLRPEAPEVGERDAARRLGPLLRRARDLGAHLHIDMESLDSRETTLELVGDLLADLELRDGPSAGLVLQAYLRDSPEEFRQILAWAAASERRHPLVVRLVKGTYWDH
jgi:proline dehydrogenase